MNYSIHKKNAVELVARANADSIRDLIQFLDPISASARITARLLASEPALMHQDKVLEHMFVHLENHPNIGSFFLALKNGAFRQVQRTDKSIPIGGRVPPDGARYVSWVIERSNHQNAQSVYTFFGSRGDVLGKFSSPTSYDPRKRAFYEGAAHNFTAGKIDTPFVDDPFFSASTKQSVIGVTYPIIVNGQLIGTATSQARLQSFADFLTTNKISKNSQTIIFSADGSIIAHPDIHMGFSNVHGNLVLKKLSALEGSPAASAMKIHEATGLNQIEFAFGEHQTPYLAIFNSFPDTYFKPWSVVTTVPLDDFTSDLNSINDRLILFGMLTFLIIALLSAYLSKLISMPLEGLTIEIQNLLSFKNLESTLTSSCIYEISTLSKALEKLKSTISAFTAYVPKDLVSELLNSGRGIELGGESRYLTILFSDLKDFSTLSEITPSRELLLRISSYFELMTYAIKEEGGTVDKFIGDSVMAFWGAPRLNENHAYHACVAAIKAQKRMVLLNNRLIAEQKAALTIRIGIHSDAVLVGNIGSAERLSYTVMGDGVNIASRLEDLNKEFGTKICVSHSILKEAGERLWLRPMDKIVVKGRKSELLVYELLGTRDGDSETMATLEDQGLCAQTSEAFECYLQGNFAQASSLYEGIAAQFDDPLSRVMSKKCASRLTGGNPPTG